MTPKQKKVLDFIVGFHEQNGYQPSQLEIAQGCGFESLGAVQHYLKLLEREGHLSRQWNAKRGLQLNVAEVAPPVPPEVRMELPLVGIVAAGRPVEAYQMTDAIEVPSAMAGPGNGGVRGARRLDGGNGDHGRGFRGGAPAGGGGERADGDR